MNLVSRKPTDSNNTEPKTTPISSVQESIKTLTLKDDSKLTSEPLQIEDDTTSTAVQAQPVATKISNWFSRGFSSSSSLSSSSRGGDEVNGTNHVSGSSSPALSPSLNNARMLERLSKGGEESVKDRRKYFAVQENRKNTIFEPDTVYGMEKRIGFFVILRRIF
jgi:hypothetical protein